MKIFCEIALLTCFFACNKEKDNSIGYAELLSVHRTVDKKDIWEKSLRNKIVPYSDLYQGNSFINEKGYPVSNEYNKVRLSLDELDNFEKYIYVEPNEGYSCEPIYRDAIIIYNNKGVPISWINICFECEMIFKYPEKEKLDSKTEKLKDVFKEYKLIKE